MGTKLTVENINDAEQFLADWLNDNLLTPYFSDLELFILPKTDTEDKEFIGLLLVSVPPDDFNSIELDYNVVVRLKKMRETLFDDRNNVIKVFSSMADDIKDASDTAGENGALAFSVSVDNMSFSMDDDFYDIVFPVSILI